MNSKSNCCIVIPIYKEKIDDHEDISLRQLIKVLGNYPIIFVAPYSMKVDSYLSYFNKAKAPAVEFFEDYFFSNTVTYSQLLLKKKFYLRFKKYTYMLIHQLDAFVFRDEVEYWCNKNLDYIGAPWVEALNQPDDKFITGIGNGGFCLRKVSSMLRFLYNLKTIEILSNYLKFNYKGRIRYFFKYLIRPLLIDDLEDAVYIKNYHINEDQFICRYSVPVFENFLKRNDFFAVLFSFFTIRRLRIAELQDALAFSFEWEPERQIALNNNSLPFGCHAWQKNLHFWKSYIEKFGYSIEYKGKVA